MDNKDTEQHIKDTAKHIFFVKGHIKATMQEIADEAKVNRALLHYYFRNREKLLLEILKEAMEEGAEFSFKIIGSDLPFEKKIEEVVALTLDRTIKYPYLNTFAVSELLRKTEEEIKKLKRKRNEALEKKFLEEAKNYIDANKLPHVKPEQFFVNMVSLCSYPAIMKPLLMKNLSMDEEQYTEFIKERKSIITNLLLGKH